MVFTSPLLVYGGNPQSFLDSPAVEIIRHIPSTWDDTIVLPPSEIGEVAVFARRKGRDWYLAGLNATGTRTITVTPSFLGAGRFAATIARDDPSNAAAVRVESSVVSSTSPLTFELREGGGFVVRLSSGGS